MGKARGWILPGPGEEQAGHAAGGMRAKGREEREKERRKEEVGGQLRALGAEAERGAPPFWAVDRGGGGEAGEAGEGVEGS